MHTRLHELRSRWEAGLAQGRDLTATELCHDCPELADQLELALSQWRAVLVASGQLPVEATLVSPSTQKTASPVADHSRTSVPGYELLKILGRGGMGVVYQARQTALNRIVALKMILSGQHAGADEQRRFLLEAEAVATVSHPGIVQVYEYGTLNELPFLAMEYCDGGSLSDYLRETLPTPREAAQLISHLARAAQAAHARGIVHRDLKPANVLLGAVSGRSSAVSQAEGGSASLLNADRCSLTAPKITDFGLAKRVEEDSRLTRSGAMMGTPAYMSPEQAQGQRKIGPASDIWSLGVILYECLAGRVPFVGESSLETAQKILNEEPEPPRKVSSRVPEDLDTICLKCLRKDPAKRYASAAELADDLDRFLADEVIHARPVRSGERFVKWVRRQPLVAALLALLILSMLAGGTLTGLALMAAQEEKKIATEERDRAQDAARALERNLAASLLLPLGHRADPLLNDFELQALEELARLGDDRRVVRLLFVENALDDPDRSIQFSRRLGPCLRASVGLDEGLQIELRDRVAERFPKSGSPESKLLAARILAHLGGDSESLTLLLETAATSRFPAERERCLGDLERAAPYLDQKTASAVAASIAKWMSKADEAREAHRLANLFAQAATKLTREEAAGHARTLLEAMIPRLSRTDDISQSEHTLALRAVAKSCDSAGANAAIENLRAMATEKTHSAVLSAVALAFESAASQADVPSRETMARHLTELAIARLPKSRRGESPNLAGTARAAAPSLKRSDASALARALIEVSTSVRFPDQQVAVAGMASALLPRLETNEVDNLASAVVSLAKAARSEQPVLAVVAELSKHGEAIGEQAWAKYSSELASAIQSRYNPELETQEYVRFVESIVALSSGLGNERTGEELARLTIRMLDSLDNIQAERCPGIAETVPRLTRWTTKEQAEELLLAVNRRIGDKTPASGLWVLAAVHGAVVAKVDDVTARPARASLLAALKREAERLPDPKSLPQRRLLASSHRLVAKALAALGPGIDPDKAGAIADLLAQRAIESAQIDLPTAAETLQALWPRLESKGKQKFADQIGASIVAEASKADAERLRLLAKDYKTAMTTLYKPGERLAGAKALRDRARALFTDDATLPQLLALVEAYWHVRDWAGNEGAKEASWRASQIIVRATAGEAMPEKREAWIGVAMHLLDDEQFLELLKHPACVGSAEQAVRSKLGERHQREFRDVREVMIWAKERELQELMKKPSPFAPGKPRLRDERLPVGEIR